MHPVYPSGLYLAGILQHGGRHGVIHLRERCRRLRLYPQHPGLHLCLCYRQPALAFFRRLRRMLLEHIGVPDA